MAIQLNDDRRRVILDAIVRFHRDTFDEELSTYRAERLLEFFLAHLGPPVYNQALQDACASMQEKLQDLDAEFHEPELPLPPPGPAPNA